MICDRLRSSTARGRPLLRAFYKAPAIDMHNRMKVAVQLLGILPHATVRPPLNS
jgi:4-hydroxy-tetrahydrodipicolinate synthase